MYIVILGGGKLGEYLATSLLKENHSVALIDKKEDVAHRLADNLQGSLLVIHGDGCEVSIQEDAGLSQADIFVAASGKDEDNLAACQLASRIFHVPRCIARVNSPKNLRIFRRLGIESISSTALIARMIQEEAMIGSMSVAVTMTSDSVGMTEIKIPRMRHHSDEEGVRALDIKFGPGIRAMAVSRKSDVVEVIDANTQIYPGDSLIVVADTDKMPLARDVIRAL